MSTRERLPRLSGDRLYITDGGLETSLIFDRGLDLPCFAAFVLLADEDGRAALRDYFEPYLAIARAQEVGFVLDTATWRANPDWGAQLGYTPETLDEANRAAVAFAEELRAGAESETTPIAICGVIGPRGDGYDPGEMMSAEEARGYHARQVSTFAGSAADLVCGVTLTYPDEAVGIVLAAEQAGIPAAISFTVETDGRLPDGTGLGEAIEHVDAQTGGAARYFMVNCAHPTHFAGALQDGGAWLDRIGGVRANASTRSHAELDEATELDPGDPVDLGARYRELRAQLQAARVAGGCCGTDARHIAEVCAAWS